MKIKSIFSVLVLTMLFWLGGEAYAQTSDSDTEFILEAGINERSARFIEGKIEDILSAINSWVIHEEDRFPDETGVDSLKRLISREELISKYDTLSSIILNFEGTFEVPRIFLQPRFGGEFEYTELIFTLSLQGALIGVRKADNILNIDRIINRNLQVNEEEKAQIESFLNTYSRIFSEKDPSSLRTLFNEDALVVVGSRIGNSENFRYTRYQTETYLSRLESNTLVERNEVEVLFDSLIAYRHPQKEDVFGFQVYQYWNTTAYSDRGYMFFIVDLSGEQPKLLARFWQESPFRAGIYSQLLPDPKILLAQLIEVRAKEVNDSLTYAHQYNVDEGVVTIQIRNGKPEILNAPLLLEWFNNGKAALEGTDLVIEEAVNTDNLTLRLPFEVDWEQGRQQVATTFRINDTELLNGLSTKLTLYLQRNNVVQLDVFEEGNEPEQIGELPDPMGEIIFTSNVANINVDVQTGDGNTLFSNFVTDTVFSYRLLEGMYRFDFSKPGFLPFSDRIQLHSNEQRISQLILSPEPIVPDVIAINPVQTIPVKKESFITKNKYWLIGGVAVLLTATAIGLSRGDSGGPGIPIPPGRPVGAF
ncbi:MAG: hypothetical protein ABJR05_12335 [Balneola sp.]